MFKAVVYLKHDGIICGYYCEYSPTDTEQSTVSHHVDGRHTGGLSKHNVSLHQHQLKLLVTAVGQGQGYELFP